MATLARRVVPRDWSWALRNLQLVFGPQLDPPSLSRLASIVYEQFFRSCLEGLRHNDVFVRAVNLDRLRAACDDRRGVILCSVHLGCWEPGIRYLVKEGLPLAVVYRKATNPLSDREFQAVRASYGAEWIDADDPIKMVKALREGKVLGLMTDLDTPGSGVVADYLGLKAMCPPGPARLALRYGCPIIPCIFVRDGEASATVHFEPRLEPTDSDNGESALVRLTKRINTTFEPWVLEYAEQYNWLHPRWRYRPDGRTWQHTDPIESQWAERVSPFPQLSERVRRIIHSKP